MTARDIHVTVATVVSRDDQYLLVEERDKQTGQLVFNQPAGHLEMGESLAECAHRETLEETGWKIDLKGILGVALYTAPTNGITYHRTTFVGQPIEIFDDYKLDSDIHAVHWMTYGEIEYESARMRSPLVLAAIERHRRGVCYPGPDIRMNSNSATKVIVGMSGGVDSSVSALLLKQQGYTVEGLFMKNWEEDDGTEYCTAKEDYADAQQVADKLGIPLHGANFAAEYWDHVFEHFLAEYRAGRTPNPDILCNREIKFKAFLEYALALGADFIATGHYTRRGQANGKATLLKGLDPNKDQSYFLHAVGHDELGRTLFPIGEVEKPKVRNIAQEHGLATARKKDSTGICFIGERRFSDFLQQYLPAQPGDIFSLEGECLGRHQGLMYHTIGQRQGLGIGGHAEHGDEPWYVVGKDLANNVLLVAQGNQHPALFAEQLLTGNIYWVSGEEPELPLRCAAKIRYRQDDQACVLDRQGDHYHVVFDQPQRAVAPGQSAVFYSGDQCLGGGVIERAGAL